MSTAALATARAAMRRRASADATDTEKAFDAMADDQKTVPPAPVFADRGATSELEQGTAFTPKFDSQGLIPAIVTDVRSGDVVMFAWMNALSLQRTIETGWATYWSRSRGGLWVKGETSSNRQKVVEIRTDCDQDAIWIKVEVEGHGASCHTGHVSCFYRAVPIGRPVSPSTTLEMCEGAPRFDAAEVYGKHD